MTWKSLALGEHSYIQPAVHFLHLICPSLELLGMCRTWGIWQTDTLPHGVSNSACQIHGVWYCKTSGQGLLWDGEIVLEDILEGKRKGSIDEIVLWASGNFQWLKRSPKAQGIKQNRHNWKRDPKCSSEAYYGLSSSNISRDCKDQWVPLCNTEEIILRSFILHDLEKGSDSRVSVPACPSSQFSQAVFSQCCDYVS